MGGVRNDDKNKKIEVIDGTGDVFADLGLQYDDEDLLKVSIARAITKTLQRRNLTQSEAARIIGVDQAKVSALTRGRLRGLSVDRLIRFLVLLGKDVDIHISQKHKENKLGRVKVIAV